VQRDDPSRRHARRSGDRDGDICDRFDSAGGVGDEDIIRRAGGAYRAGSRGQNVDGITKWLGQFSCVVVRPAGARNSVTISLRQSAIRNPRLRGGRIRRRHPRFRLEKVTSSRWRHRIGKKEHGSDMNDRREALDISGGKQQHTAEHVWHLENGNEE
jgi:hypothetical protein